MKSHLGVEDAHRKFIFTEVSAWLYGKNPAEKKHGLRPDAKPRALLFFDAFLGSKTIFLWKPKWKCLALIAT